VTILGLEFDRGAWYLVAVNLFASGTALYTGMSIADLLLVYWAQSVLMGLGTVIRILRLRRYSTHGISGWQRGSPEEDLAEKRKFAWTFALFHGIFSLACLVAIVGFISPITVGKAPLAFTACATIFALQYGWELVQSMRADAAGEPEIGYLAVPAGATLATLLIVCMITGPAMKGGAGPAGLLGLALLTFYKTCTDVSIHCLERDRQKQSQGPYIS
jgi:hypothetical protein